MTPRHLMMVTGLVASAALALWGDKRPDGADDAAVAAPATAVVATATTPVRRAGGHTVPDSSILLVQARHLVGTDGQARPGGPSPFASASWAPAEPVSMMPAVPVQAEAPSAPMVPFTVLGKALSNNVWEVFLANGASTYVVHEQSTVDDNYRIDSIQPPTMQLTYLPMNTVQTLDIGAAQ
ncbi:hypothetical protein [Stenotrophomonas sp. 24(2023)]|uniref:hypothetical protein n=1 Tax=Stenotrophomonas sp. 24(2023) TaxID=3068324 RepID=UPI0027DF494C|nr:hypothetical protein [Stenotrophomonas sp. 24(2023)]WMJ70177.1 hypothetical protein Q9R17_03465 [Stenotrophomonas sp. 24(2023)]